MVRQPILACALALGMAAGSALPAQASSADWTVLTLAPDGAWGAATDASVNRAIADAIRDCKTRAQAELGCGGHYTTIQAGWSLGIRCGREIIVVAEHKLDEAERAGLAREMELRQHYVPDMAACLRVVTVDPHGTITAHNVADTASGNAPAPSPGVRDTAEIPVWRAVTLGTFRDVNMLLDALDSIDCGRGTSHRERGERRPTPCTLGDTAGQAIARPAFNVTRTPVQASLVVLSAAELGLRQEDGVRVADIYARARQRGLELCAAEVGPQLRLQYLDQPLGEFLRIAMEPIAIYGGDLVDLTLANGGGALALVGGDGNPDLMVHPSTRFVFARPTRVAQPVVP